MEISTFDDLLRAAGAQPEPQRLLFVFAGAELPEDSTPEQRENFGAGQGGTLTPLMSVDKSPEDLVSFEALVEESLQFAPDWAIVFVAGLAGRAGVCPTSEDTDLALTHMIEAVKAGRFGTYMPFDRSGAPVMFE